MADEGRSRGEIEFDASGQVCRDVDPFHLTRQWLEEAVLDQPWANAVSLATAGSTGRVSCRYVLLRIMDEGLYFGTSFESRKAQDLTDSPFAALAAFWQKIRQWRVEGRVQLASDTVADRLFAEAPVAEQLLIWASRDGRPQGFDELDRAFEHHKAEFSDRAIPRPDKWKVFQLLPDTYEFWEADVAEWKHRCRRFARDGQTGEWINWLVGP